MSVDARVRASREPRALPGRAQCTEGEPLGIVLLDAAHYVETLEWEDPTAWEPPGGLGPGFLSHPAYWSLPVVYAVARGATTEAAAAHRPEAIRGVAEAVRRLDGRCRMIVGTCGHFCDAWDELDPRPETPTVLSALDVLDDALRWSRRDVLVLTMTTQSGQRSIGRATPSARVRVLGMDGAGDWSRIDRPDWVTHREWSEEGLESGLREVLDRERGPSGALCDVGAVLLYCTILPQFTSVIREYTSAPIMHVGSVVDSVLSGS